MTRTARPHARPAAPAKQPGGNRTAIVATVLGLATTCLLGWLWLTSGEDLVDKTLKMERTLLAGEASGRAGKKAVDEIIMGSHGRGALAGALVGSVAQKVVHLSPVPVVLVK